jgi:hypothetical protein
VVLGQPLVVGPALDPTAYDRHDRHGGHQTPDREPQAGESHADPRTGEARGADPGPPSGEGREVAGVLQLRPYSDYC